MLDHIGLKVETLDASRRFYLESLKPLGYGLVMEYESFVGFGPPGKPAFWISPGPLFSPIHVAFVAPNRAAVDAFYRAAIAAGARDNGPPGLRSEYHQHYYGAFVLDLDGNNIEAVCHRPPAP
jgi:catechol 2,3-dioxygenase-like lactoylglutathione lyase family enzyme